MPEYIYVLGRDGSPQMPTTRRRHVQKLLDTGKARIAEHVPCTIQLLYDNTPVLQPVTFAEDPGRTNIGMAALSLKGELLFSAVCETRNKEIAKLMEDRRKYRRASRSGERKARQRLAIRFGTVLKAGMMMRKLPKYAADKFITCKVIRNTESRFCNRKRDEGWLTPSVNHLVDTHIHLLHKMQKFLPITDVALEVNRFAFLLLEDPSISGVDFQNGPLKGFDNRDAAVYDLQDGKCLLCRKEIEHYHHIVPKSRGGSNTLGNIAGLCKSCHDRVHKDTMYAKRLEDLKKGLDKKYGALSVLNQAVPFLCQRLEQEFGKEHGEIGEDVLHNVKTFKNVPLKINTKREVIIDGEAIITYKDFNKINESLPEGEKYKNPRNLAAGSVKQLDSSIVAQRNLKFIAWKFVKGSTENDFYNRLTEMQKLGFEVVLKTFVPVYSDPMFGIENDIELLKQSAENLGYPIDGMVLGYKDIVYGDSLEATGHHLRSQIAFKFYDEEVD